MSSSSTERDEDVVSPARRSFWSVDRGGLIRLGIALAFALAALLSPLVGTTSAQFTDTTEVSVTFTTVP